MKEVAISRVAALILFGSLLVQLLVALLPDTMGDVLHYRLWTRKLVNDGIMAAYWPSSLDEEFPSAINYPPVYPYVLYATGKLFHSLDREAFLHNDRWLDTLVKVPSVIANFVIVCLLLFEWRRSRRSDPMKALMICALNPALIFNTSYWGQSDSIPTLLLLGSFIALQRGNAICSAALLTVGMLTKPLIYPFIPLLALAFYMKGGAIALLRAIAASSVVALVLLLPFLWEGKLIDFLGVVARQIDYMPFATVNAHNVWWILTAGPPWLDAHAEVGSLISLRHIGICLFLIFLAITLWKFWQRSDGTALYTAGAGAAFGLFMLLTQMHENHFFYFFPLFGVIAFGSKRSTHLYCLLTVTFLFNLALHDPFLQHVLEQYIPGQRYALPEMAGLPQATVDFYATRVGRHMVDFLRGEHSFVWLIATFVNAQLQFAIFLLWTALFYFNQRFAFHRTSPAFIMVAVITFLLITSLPLVFKISRLL